MSLASAVFAARVGDLLREAQAELTAEEFEDVLVLASSAIAKRVADRIETRWQDGR